MHRTVAVAAAALAVVFSAATAAADPVAGTPCPPDAAGAATRPADVKLPLVCTGGTWQAETAPQAPSDRWLSVGPPILLHGEGLRNADVESGEWVATPRTADTRCRAEQLTVLGPGILSEPEVAEGAAGEPLEVTFAPRLFNLQLSGDCLWARKG
ncbi:hypothetical protein BST36_16250 [Mycolicibacterium moriokaense]|uniref:Uncharacterized protein n=1 Tax=Mycolicibacterium moriokaense TaxID=39691 RepID=A0AAD1HAI5_9MYCO|nr:hypothetical protein [Mycolicibacterium moriokaense]MCV7040797.1 hypothetical protein [Mycolicibacterium moriokaense]ORB21488.1 hypothetical protein BST36_16250 [Mycolicibacterium moriokaense]BBX00353.1 hypothetical protein MMOR_12890 [Mycolicibacterium moriokaense]